MSNLVNIHQLVAGSTSKSPDTLKQSIISLFSGSKLCNNSLPTVFTRKLGSRYTDDLTDDINMKQKIKIKVLYCFEVHISQFNNDG